MCEGIKTPFNEGDTVQFSPFSEHCVINETDEPFEMYGIWWDADMSARFTQRHLLNAGENNNV